uniref:glycosyltransferase n=1 Tax=Silvanigrella sp. TaxID=2024976 RepID=UPI0037C86C06
DDYKYFLNKVKIHKKNIFLVEGSGVNKNEFKYYSELNYNETPIILFPARIIKEKGIKELIEASKNLTNKNFKHEVWIAGDIDLGNPSSLSLFEVNILKNEALNLKFLGYQKDMPKILEQCTIVCLPSYREGLPKALIEASACGRPIITCDVPGCNEIVEDNFNGVLVKPKSSIDLENAIENLLQDGEKMERLRKNAYNKFLNNYTSEITVNKIFQVYLSI